MLLRLLLYFLFLSLFYDVDNELPMYRQTQLLPFTPKYYGVVNISLKVRKMNEACVLLCNSQLSVSVCDIDAGS